MALRLRRSVAAAGRARDSIRSRGCVTNAVSNGIGLMFLKVNSLISAKQNQSRMEVAILVTQTRESLTCAPCTPPPPLALLLTAGRARTTWLWPTNGRPGRPRVAWSCRVTSHVTTDYHGAKAKNGSPFNQMSLNPSLAAFSCSLRLSLAPPFRTLPFSRENAT